MLNIAIDNDLINTAEQFFNKIGVGGEIKVCPLNEPCTLSVLYHANKDVAKMLENINPKMIIIANSDDFSLMRLLGGAKCTVISCGLSNRDTITASSISNECGVVAFELCIQRGIWDLNKNYIEPQEFCISLKDLDIDINKAMLFSSALILCGLSKTFYKDNIII